MVDALILSAPTKDAMAAPYPDRTPAAFDTHDVDRSVSSETRINGRIHVHAAATDARGIAADIEPHVHRGQAAGRAGFGLAWVSAGDGADP